MKTFIKNASFVILTSVISTSVLADNVIVSTGIRGGKYDGTYGVNVQKYLTSKGHKVTLNNSAGSEENLARLASGQADITFATVDAYSMLLKRGGQSLNILATLLPECAYMVVAKNGKVKNEDDLQSVKDAKIAIGEAGSGSAVMWNYMTQLESGYKNASVVLQGGTIAINMIGTPDGPDAFLFVTSKDNLTHKLVQAVNVNKNLKFVDVNDKDLNDRLPNGKEVYTFQENRVCEGWIGCKVETICTDAAIFYSNTAPQRVVEDLSDIMAMSRKTITGE